MNQVAQSALDRGIQGASMGSIAGPWGAAIGFVGGATYGAIEGEQIVEDERLEDLRVDRENREGKLLAQSNANKSQDPSYSNSNFSSISGTNTLPMSDPNKIQQPTQRDQQLQSLGLG
jgi:hypothetical protein